LANILPLRGVLYNKDLAESMAELVAPPYDVISPALREELYRRSPYNIVRLDYGKESPDDTPSNNRYTRAAELYRRWRSEQILVRDETPSIYIYRQTFCVRGETLTRTGFIALVELQPFDTGQVRPHERTLTRPKEDRLKLTRETRAVFSSIFGLCPGGGSDLLSRAIADRAPRWDFVDHDGIRNILWSVSRPELVEEIAALCRGREIFIADGHHRYETALAYQSERREAEQPTTPQPYDYALMTLVSMDDPGLIILPTHRLVRLPDGMDVVALLEQLAAVFEIREPPPGEQPDALIAEMERALPDRHVLGLYAPAVGFRLLELRDTRVLDECLPPGKPSSWRELDVNIFHYAVFARILGLDQDRWSEAASIAYVREDREALDRTHSGEFDVAFFLNPTRVEQVREVSRAGERMPQKSTFFYPKLLTGLVISDLESW